MLKKTFIHIPSIGAKTEQSLWLSGVADWDKFKEPFLNHLPFKKIELIKEYLNASKEHIKNDNPNYFTDLMQSNLHWRMFPEFRHLAVFLDIETTGLDPIDQTITTIALYNGKSIFYYVKNINLDDFIKDIKQYKVIITYNGKCFDVPFIEKYFGINMTHAHIDLRYILSGLGFKGGLKACEKNLGIQRGELHDIDGYFAILLWYDYIKKRNKKALETLLAYNIQDVVNLEKLIIIAYNLRLKETPFFDSLRLDIPSVPDIPFKADIRTIERIKNEYTFFY